MAVHLKCSGMLSRTRQGDILCELKEVTEKLRFGNASSYLGSADMPGVKDALFLSYFSGPSVDETGFVTGLAQSLSAHEGDWWMQLLSLPGHDHEDIFTHGRNPQNILGVTAN